MAFMEPEYTNEPFYVGETKYGDGVAYPCSAHGIAGSFAENTGALLDTVEVISGKWWCRLSASGYMDCTDWHGPFATADQARNEIEIFYEVDPDTGDELDEEPDDA
jgi:hypothetical protein